MCHCWLAKCLELWIVHMLVLPKPRHPNTSSSTAFLCIGGQQRFGELCSAEQGQKEEGLRVPCWKPDADNN